MAVAVKKEDMIREIDRLIVPAKKIKYDESKPIAIRNGGFLKTYIAQHEDWGTVAFKKLKVNFIKDAEGDKLKREAAIQRQLNHQNIVTLMGMVYEKGTYGLIMEYMKFGDVKKFLKDYDVLIGWKLNIIHDVVLGMQYLHTQHSPITHADLTTQNILIGEGFRAKITDFGFCEWKDFSRSLSADRTESGTVTHIPPENWSDPRESKSVKFDVYGFGIAVWEIMSQQECYDVTGAGDICKRVLNGKRPNVDCLGQDVPIKIKQLIVECWCERSIERPSFGDIKQTLDALCFKKQEEINEAKKCLNKQEKTPLRDTFGNPM